MDRYIFHNSIFCLKATQCDDITFRLQFFSEVVYPTDNYCNFFRFFIFSKTFPNIYNNIHKNQAITQTYQCIEIKDD